MVKKILKWFVVFCFSMGIFVGIYSFTVIADTPKINPDHIYDYLPESSVLLDDQGNEIDSIYMGDGNRVNIKYEDMPENLVNAVVAIEDKTFWKHHGFNFMRILGAIKESILDGGNISGTSTITQQLARNVYLAESKSSYSIDRKISEAYYSIVLEKNMSKEQIMEAYLNTIYLGNNSFGVEMAAKSYFNKSAKDLDLIECVSLASLPKAPDAYALIKKRDAAAGDAGLGKDQPILLKTNDYIYYYNGGASEARRKTTLKFMEDQNLINESDKNKALEDNLLAHIKLDASSASSATSYFTDYIISTVINDYAEKYGCTTQEAKEKLYSGGLKIHTTLNSKAQNAIEEEFANDANFPANTDVRYDSQKNIIDSAGNIMLYDYDNYFDSNGMFTLHDDEFTTRDGDLVLYKGKRLNFYNTAYNGVTEYNIEFKNMYEYKNNSIYSIEGGVITVPREYKSLDNDGNLVISKDFFTSTTVKNNPNMFKKSGSTYSIDKSGYSLRNSVRQPQAAMVITDYRTGQLKAMVGGRETIGKMLYNRAINPRQPGSSIKPLSVYSAALQQGQEAASSGSKMNFTEYDSNTKSKYYGDYWTASSGINDEPIKMNGSDWPKNWYPGYKGLMTMRHAVEQSVNTAAVRVYQQVGDSYIVDQLKKFGITSIETEGSNNDMNPSALALGGMTRGISPMEMSAAFGVFPNGGVLKETTVYTSVENKKGEVLLKSESKETKVLDKGVSFIMQDILKSTVNNGIAARAKVPGQVTCGKTGTTSNSMDIWFSGFTPQYSAALWIGNDVNITIDATSDAVASLWSRIMTKATAGMGGSLLSQPSNVVRLDGEYYISGTQKGRQFMPGMSQDNVEDKDKDKDKDKDANKNPDENKDSVEPETPETPDGDGDEVSPDQKPDEGGNKPTPETPKPPKPSKPSKPSPDGGNNKPKPNKPAAVSYISYNCTLDDINIKIEIAG